MKNIPMFTTNAGVAGLVLEEIPYKKEAYITIHSAVAPEKLIEEAVSFCKAVGADTVYASGHAFLAKYPFHTEQIRMECSRIQLSAGSAQLCPLDDGTLSQWCEIYNTYMRSVPNASSMSADRARKLLAKKQCYFVYDDELLLGIGKAGEGKVDAVISVVCGRGRDVMLALCGVLTDDLVTVEVASNNIPAIKLYRKMGFTEKEKLSKWYCVYKK